MSRLWAIALVLVAAGSAQAAEKTLDRTFKVSPGGSLKVDTDGSSVHVTGSDGNEVVVHMIFSGSDKDVANAQLDAIQNGNDVTVTLRKRERNWFSWGIWSSKQEIEVTVPRRYTVDVQTGGGSVELRDTVGAATLRTSGGDVRAKNVAGNVEARTSGGSILVESIRGDVDASTSGGDVRLLHVDGRIRGKTNGGSVRCSLVGANRGIDATTNGGDIELTVPRGITGNIDASTNGGSVNTSLPVTVTEKDDNELVGTLNGGGARIFAHTSGGSISLRAED